MRGGERGGGKRRQLSPKYGCVLTMLTFLPSFSKNSALGNGQLVYSFTGHSGLQRAYCVNKLA